VAFPKVWDSHFFISDDFSNQVIFILPEQNYSFLVGAQHAEPYHKNSLKMV
jgi:hypothetical protein